MTFDTNFSLGFRGIRRKTPITGDNDYAAWSRWTDASDRSRFLPRSGMCRSISAAVRMIPGRREFRSLANNRAGKRVRSRSPLVNPRRLLPRFTRRKIRSAPASPFDDSPRRHQLTPDPVLRRIAQSRVNETLSSVSRLFPQNIVNCTDNVTRRKATLVPDAPPIVSRAYRTISFEPRAPRLLIA